jgi:hypothetical protein
MTWPLIDPHNGPAFSSVEIVVNLEDGSSAALRLNVFTAQEMLALLQRITTT